MTISVVIPVYNVAPYLERCLDSVLVDNQFRDEVICVNDGSTDNSLDILNEYATCYANMRIITRQNAGLSAARNTGLDAATGDYVFFLDSDDWILKDQLSEVVGRIHGEDVVYFNAVRYFEDTQILEQSCDIAECSNLSGPDFLQARIGRTAVPMVSVWGGLYRRAFLLENGLYNEPGLLHEDSYFTPQVLLCAERVSQINIVLYVYRIREGSITSSVRVKHIEDMLFICRNLYDKFVADKRANAAFFTFVSDSYVTTLLEAYDNQIDLKSLWRRTDSQVMLRYARNDYYRRIARLTFLSPHLAYRYAQDTLPPLIRKIIVRCL